MNIPKEIGIVGVGYVGLPLAMCFSKKFKVTAFDRNPKRVAELNSGVDRTHEVNAAELKQGAVRFTDDPVALKGLSFLIVTVPTPVTEFNVPDLEPLLSSCETLAKVLTPGCTIVFESTVYPGLTEEVLAPKLEQLSGLKFNKDFFLGYSPERVNPGDREHTIPKIKKIVSGSTSETLALVDRVYSTIIEAGVHKAPSIAVAEAAKVIENIQRDVNIGLINELTVLFDRLGLDVYDVLEASATKWNFLRFSPGLVGGHCIGVDPYYLTHKASEVGFHPEMILAGRRINDSMAEFYADKMIQQLLLRNISPLGTEVLVLGFTFKENCPDTRNTKVFGLVKALEKYGMKPQIVDPVADREMAKTEYGVDISASVPEQKKFKAVILAVTHSEFKGWLESSRDAILDSSGVLLDIKGVLKKTSNIVR